MPEENAMTLERPADSLPKAGAKLGLKAGLGLSVAYAIVLSSLPCRIFFSRYK